MNKIIAILTNLCKDESFIFGFPLASLAVISFLTNNPLAPIALAVWIIVILVNYGSK